MGLAKPTGRQSSSRRQALPWLSLIHINGHAKNKSVRLSPADADKRVSNVIGQAKTDLDTARKAAAKLSLWLTAALLFGAFAASLAATQGGKVRDFNASLTDG
jgi:hypothetical protein